MISVGLVIDKDTPLSVQCYVYAANPEQVPIAVVYIDGGARIQSHEPAALRGVADRLIDVADKLEQAITQKAQALATVPA